MREHRKPLSSVLVKPAGPDCNLACRYRFYLDHARLFPPAVPHRMDERVLDATVRQALAAASRRKRSSLPAFCRARRSTRSPGTPGLGRRRSPRRAAVTRTYPKDREIVCARPPGL